MLSPHRMYFIFLVQPAGIPPHFALAQAGARARAGAKQLSGSEYGPLKSDDEIAFRQQGRFVRRTKLARTQKLRSEKGCSQHYLGELQLVMGTGTSRRTGVEAAAGAAGAAAGAGAGAEAGAEGGDRAGAGVGMAAGAAAGAAAGEQRPTKAIASKMYDHRSRQQKQQRARQRTLMVYLRRQQRQHNIGHPRMVQRRRHF